jgi:hypothetical protein
MQILLNADPHTVDREAMLEHLDAVVREVLGQFGNRITRVEAYLTRTSGTNGTAQAGVGDSYCTLEVRLVEHDPVVARHHAGTANQAIHGALRKLSCVLASEFEKQDHRHAHPVYADASFLATPQAAAPVLQP